MTKSETEELIKKLKRQVRELRSERDDFSDKYWKERARANRLKEWVDYKFSWWIDLMADDKKPCLKYMIKDAKDILVKTNYT